jgi:hypothetical protein
MTTDLTLFSKIISMPPNLKEEVLRYINYLLFSQGVEIMQTKPKKTPKAGFSSVNFVMSPDFDAPLEDFKEYME